MSLERISQREESIARRYDYDDEEQVIVADFGTAEVSVDVLDDVAIVVVEGEENYQTELELPEGEAQAFINNGVLTIEVGR
ncbi:DUF7127 family protein [Halomicrococcus sp. NG-SE-24]|uniref:DUF7127 family protein n=1 Tax=Halomicrococcus sp. NG-SE-24 TaxID=3436928 RepID=UPI003D99BA73